MQIPSSVPDESGVAAGERQPPQGKLGCAAARAEEGVFEERVLFERVMSDRDLAAVVIQTFLEDIPSRLSEATGLLHRRDRAGLLLHVHTIKGSAANVGAKPLSLEARELEADIPEESFERIAARLLSLEQRFEEVRVEMLAVLGRYSSKEI